MYYLEQETPGLDRRIFRYENRIGSHIEFAYYAEYLVNGERSRWYGYALKTIPDGSQAITP